MKMYSIAFLNSVHRHKRAVLDSNICETILKMKHKKVRVNEFVLFIFWVFYFLTYEQRQPTTKRKLNSPSRHEITSVIHQHPLSIQKSLVLKYSVLLCSVILYLFNWVKLFKYVHWLIFNVFIPVKIMTYLLLFQNYSECLDFRCFMASSAHNFTFSLFFLSCLFMFWLL